MSDFNNPFRPGAGHSPPYLAGRQHEREEFLRLLTQERILENMVLTGLRGVGKTVLLETFKPLAIREGWLWVGTDLSESASVNEDNNSSDDNSSGNNGNNQGQIPTTSPSQRSGIEKEGGGRKVKK